MLNESLKYRKTISTTQYKHKQRQRQRKDAINTGNHTDLFAVCARTREIRGGGGGRRQQHKDVHRAAAATTTEAAQRTTEDNRKKNRTSLHRAPKLAFRTYYGDAVLTAVFLFAVLCCVCGVRTSIVSASRQILQATDTRRRRR